MNNTMNHVSDQASTVKFNPAGSEWPANITDVQTALSKIGAWANTDNGLPNATLTVRGVLRTCTVADVKAGTSEDRAVTPAVLKEYLIKPHASEIEYGTTKYANAAERLDVTNNVTTITPQGLDYIFTNRPATEGRAGGLRVASVSQAESATQDDVMMTPKKTLAAINKFVAGSGDATETVKGVVRIATVDEIRAGKGNEGLSISPKGFAEAIGTTTSAGTFKAASDADMINLSVDNAAVTPASLGRNRGTIGKFGIVKLSASETAEPYTALASTAQVLYRSGGTIGGNLTVNGHTTSGSLGVQAHLTAASVGVSGAISSHQVDTSYVNASQGMNVAGSRVLTVADRIRFGPIQITGYLNSMDGPLDWYVPEGCVMVGLQSYHNNGTEDRQWRIYYREIFIV